LKGKDGEKDCAEVNNVKGKKRVEIKKTPYGIK